MEKRINIKMKIIEIEMSEKPLSACDGESFCFKLSFSTFVRLDWLAD